MRGRVRPRVRGPRWGHFLNGHRTKDEFLTKAPPGTTPDPRCADETQTGSRIACTLSFSYDARERLTKEELVDNKLATGQAANLRTTDYTLDLAGNVSSEHLVEGTTDRTRTYFYDGERLIRRETGGTTDRKYFYDAEQNLACVTNGTWAGSACPAATDASLLELYSYDYRNRATRISRRGVGAVPKGTYCPANLGQSYDGAAVVRRPDLGITGFPWFGDPC